MLPKEMTKFFALGALVGAPLIAPMVSDAAANTRPGHAATANKSNKFSMYAGATGAGMFIQKGDVTFKSFSFKDAAGLTVTGLSGGDVRSAGSDTYSLTPMVVEADKGWGFSGGVLFGASIGSRASVEIEGGFLANKQLEGATTLPKTSPNTVTITAVGAATKDYQISAFAPKMQDGKTDAPVKFDGKKFIKYSAPYGMVSGMFNIPVGDGKFAPFVQAGVGMAYITAKFDGCETLGYLRETAATAGSSTTANTTITTQATADASLSSKQLPLTTVLAKDKYLAKTAVLGQGGAGVSFAMSDALSLSVSYRFMMPFSDPDFKGDKSNDDSNASAASTAAADNKINVSIKTHSLLAAVRFHF